MGDAFKRIGLTVGKIIGWINLPFVTRFGMFLMNDPINDWVTHIKVRGGHVDFCSKGFSPIGKFSQFHSFKELQVFFYRSLAVWAIGTRFHQSSAMFSHLIKSEIAYKGLAMLD